MRSGTPVLATWLLERVGICNDSLVGDLEEYHRGRSGLWYWRQVLAAIAIGSLDQIWTSKLVTVLTLTLALLLWWLGATAATSILRFLSSSLLQHGIMKGRELSALGTFIWLSVMGIVYLGIGCFVARAHRPYSIARVFVCCQHSWFGHYLCCAV